MSLNVPNGSRVFIDSTIFHYAFVSFADATPQCIGLFRRVANLELIASTSIPVLNDAIHKVMCSEAVARFNVPRAGLVNWMKSHPDRVRELTHAADVLTLLHSLPIQVIPVDVQSLDDAQQMVNAHGLLASDAMILSLMRRHDIAHLATNDDDFDTVPGLTVWKPR